MADLVRHLYMHVPFCVAKCQYCAFYSEPAEHGMVDRFLTAMECELERVSERLAPQTLFIGGGTPSILSAGQFDRLLTHLHRSVPTLRPAMSSAGFEWTVELNPDTVSLEKAELLRSHGVNRVSMGVQSLDDRTLKRLGRVHSVASAYEGVETLRAAGFDNLNLDFIFAIPGQTLQEWEETLVRAMQMGSEHLSTYEITYEDDTPLFKALEAGQVTASVESLSVAMYERLLELTAASGFQQYEISNFARPGRECRHNLNYWRGGQYVGVGPSACGYVDGWRYKNVADTRLYIERIEQGQPPIEYAERLSPKARAGELVAFALRMNEGISAAAFEQQSGFRLEQLWPEALQELAQDGVVAWDGVRLLLTVRGRLLADTVAEAFIIVDKGELGSHHPAYGN